jgi:hypothetical protein
MTKEQRPKIKLEFQSLDMILEGLALAGMAELVALPAAPATTGVDGGTRNFKVLNSKVNGSGVVWAMYFCRDKLFKKKINKKVERVACFYSFFP